MGNRRSAGHLAGLCGICLYYLLENIALTYTMASNVGVIIAVAPFFTAILSRLFLKTEGKLRANFFIGFVVAMVGVALICFNGSRMELNPVGDILAVLAAFVWACLHGYLATAARAHNFTGFGKIVYCEIGLERFADMTYLFNILYLGLGASALCFVTWNFSVKVLGAVKTSVYIRGSRYNGCDFRVGIKGVCDS